MDTVTLSLEEYNKLRDSNKSLAEENEVLKEGVTEKLKEICEKKLDKMQKIINDLDDENMEILKEKRRFYLEKLDAEIEVSRLKHRNLWQRILNK